MNDWMQMQRQPNGNWLVTYREREVKNPWTRRLLVIALLILVPFTILFAILMAVLGLFMAMISLVGVMPLGLLLDAPLKALGRHGCVTHGPSGSLSITLTRSSFRCA